MSLGQSGCAGGFIPLPAVIVQAVAVPPMGLYRRSLYRLWDCTGGRRTAYGIVQAVAVPPMYAMLSLKKGATASARTIWAAKLRLAEAAKLPVRKGLRPLWQTELATPVYHSSLRT